LTGFTGFTELKMEYTFALQILLTLFLFQPNIQHNWEGELPPLGEV